MVIGISTTMAKPKRSEIQGTIWKREKRRPQSGACGEDLHG